ncbi:hypothetical protein CAEBREN_13547 [Caenorhabditis brenneri]|uniref:Serpentine Receptor, class H n=1 Tax=Caenorhabditis brenneri TaxID=135651 RepID=G0M8U4_CAEBE|nr:hypothetical protein CAEBREN_13547 [Caenorhabditis brenneri]
MFLEALDVYRYTLHSISLIAAPFHIFGTYCIILKTPKTMNSVKWVMLNLHFWCVVLDILVAVLIVPLLIFPGLAGYPLGILTTWFGVPSIIQIYLNLTLVSTVYASILFIFENRYFQICAKSSSWRHFRVPFIVSCYLLVFTCFIPVCLNQPDQRKALEYTYKVSVFLINFGLPMGYIVLSVLTNYHNQAANNFLFVLIALHGINSTIIMLWAHKPYREVCHTLFYNLKIFFGLSASVPVVMRRPKVSTTVL